MLITSLLILIAKLTVIFATLNSCSRQMNRHNIFSLKKLTKVGGRDYYFLSRIYMFPKFIVSFSIELNETSLASENFSIILSNLPFETEKSQNKQNLYAIKFYYSKGKKLNKIIKIKRRFQENEFHPERILLGGGKSSFVGTDEAQ